MEKICICCNNVFNAPRHTQKTCSRTCAGKLKQNRILIQCKRGGCTNTFMAWPCNIKNGKEKYCSRDCYDIAQRVQTATSRICAKCHKEKPLYEFAKKSKNSDVVECYCKDCRRNHRLQHAHTPHARWLQMIRRAGKRGLKCEISFEDYNNLLSQNCSYCEGATGICGAALDRKDNNVGYTIKNVVTCCGRCNTIKSNYLTYEEMIELKPLLIKFRQKKELLARHTT